MGNNTLGLNLWIILFLYVLPFIPLVNNNMLFFQPFHVRTDEILFRASLTQLQRNIFFWIFHFEYWFFVCFSLFLSSMGFVGLLFGMVFCLWSECFRVILCSTFWSLVACGVWGFFRKFNFWISKDGSTYFKSILINIWNLVKSSLKRQTHFKRED